MMRSIIPELLQIAKDSNASFEEVFIIAYDYGISDKYGNITEEALEHEKGND